MKCFYLKTFLLIIAFGSTYAQTLVNSYPFQRFTPYDYFWGITEAQDTFWIGTDYNSTSGTYQYCWIYRVTKNGIITDSLRTPINSHHGMIWDGENFWIAEGYRAQGSRIFKMNHQGVFIDTFFVAQVIGGIPIGIGDVTLDGDRIWFTVFSPDFVSYPNSYAYAFNRFTKTLTDTLPLYGRQPLGIAVKGDTIFYVNENQFSNETERIYALSKTIKDTLFSFPAPDPDGNCNPKGLYWDGSHLWLLAERIGNSSWIYKTLYKYEISGGGTPIITTSTNTVDFGNVIIGQSGQQTFSINNIGTATLSIDSFYFSSNLFSTNQQFPVTISSSSSQNFTVNFTPQIFGNISAVLSIYSSDAGTPVKNITLFGKGINNGGVLSINANVLNYGNRDIYTLSSKSFEISNTGSQPFILESAQTYTAKFSFDTVGISFPLQIDTGITRTFRVWFQAPTTTGTFEDTLNILNNSINLPNIIIPLNVNVITRSFNYGEAMWNLQVPDNPFAYIQDYKPMSMKYGDGVFLGSNAFFIATRNYYVMRVNPNASFTGDIYWKFNTATNNNNTGAVMFQDAMQIRTDIDGDGFPEIVFGCGGGNEFVYTLSGRTGKLLWAYGDSVNYENGDINGLRGNKDFNGDGIDDVLISASGSSSGGRHAVICLNGLTGTEIFNKPQNAQYTFDIETTVWGGVICVDQGNGGPYFLNAFNNQGNPIWSQSIPDVCWSIREINDINDDGIKDLVAFIGGMNVKVMAFSGANGAVIWQKAYPNFSTFSTIKIVEDFNFNGYKDLIFSGKEGVFRLDTKTGAAIWENLGDGSYVFDTDEAVIYDWGSDTHILAGTKNGNLFKINPVNGTTLFSQNYGVPNNQAIERVKFINSLDKPYHSLIIATRDGRILGLSGGLFVIPVELSAFSYSQTANSIILNWITATETNNHKFDIYRDGNIIGTVKGKGTTTIPQSYSFEDKDVTSGKYNYKLTQIDFDGTTEILKEIEIDLDLLPKEFHLSQNFPNPFNPNTKIGYSLPELSFVKIKVFDLLGAEVSEIVNEILEAGHYEIVFNAANLPSGIYFYSIIAEPLSGNKSFTSVKKMTILK